MYRSGMQNIAVVVPFKALKISNGHNFRDAQQKKNAFMNSHSSITKNQKLVERDKKRTENWNKSTFSENRLQITEHRWYAALFFINSTHKTI